MKYADITGTILIGAEYSDGGAIKSITAEWNGGDIIGITHELLEVGDPKLISRSGNRISIAQYTVEIVGDDGRVVYARRCYD